MDKPDPLTVLCPQCWAEPGEKCTNYTGANCAPHSKRTDAAKNPPGRPGDGSDQPELFQRDAQGKLF